MQQVGAMVRMQMGQKNVVDIVDPPRGLARFDKAHQGTGPGIQQEGMAVHGHPVGGRCVGGCGHRAAGAQDVESDHGYKGTGRVGFVKGWEGLRAPGGPLDQGFEH